MPVPKKETYIVMPFTLVPFLLLIIPIVEIGVFIAIGGQIGTFYTLLMILVTAVLGTILLRIEGFRVLDHIRREMSAGRMPTRQLTSGVMIMIAGVLLLTPGFVTDAIGFLLFLPPVQAAIRAFLASRINLQTFGTGSTGGFDQHPARPDNGRPPSRKGPVIDLEDDAWTREPDVSSPWRKGDGG